MTETLKEKTAKGIFWGAMSNITLQLVGVVFGIMLGRILSDEDYGMMAMIAIFQLVAIALHNIPEGIAVAVPILYATGSRKKALLYSLLSGLAEPAGALIGFFFLLPFLTPVLLAVLFAVVAGVMIYISFDELLPMAETYGKHHIALAGVLGGMLFIGAGLEFL